MSEGQTRSGVELRYDGEEEDGQDARTRVSAKACASMRLLHEDGRSKSDIAFMLEHKWDCVSRHIDGECRHGDIIHVKAGDNKQ